MRAEYPSSRKALVAVRGVPGSSAFTIMLRTAATEGSWNGHIQASREDLGKDNRVKTMTHTLEDITNFAGVTVALLFGGMALFSILPTKFGRRCMQNLRIAFACAIGLNVSSMIGYQSNFPRQEVIGIVVMVLSAVGFWSLAPQMNKTK